MPGVCGSRRTRGRPAAVYSNKRIVAMPDPPYSCSAARAIRTDAACQVWDWPQPKTMLAGPAPTRTALWEVLMTTCNGLFPRPLLFATALQIAFLASPALGNTYTYNFVAPAFSA